MDNYAIADNFSLLAKLMDIHGDNSFKAKSYAAAAFTIEKLPVQLAETDPKKIFSLKGIGESAGQKILEQLQTGELEVLNEYIAKTPPGIIEMLQYIKGLGPKKIAVIWKEMDIETVGELLYACEENRLTRYKGFGEKTQQSVKESIEFYLGTKGSYLYQQIESYTNALTEKLLAQWPEDQLLITGQFRRQMDIIDKLDWVTTVSEDEICSFFSAHGYEMINQERGYVVVRGKENISLGFYCSGEEQIISQLFATSCSSDFFDYWLETTGWDAATVYETEESIFEDCNCAYIPPPKRESPTVIDAALNQNLNPYIQASDIKGIIHSHSKWSDGVHSIEEMALGCIERGLEYLVISDHSKTAAYAQGLQVERVLAQHGEIDELNQKLAPFKIFKSIESDILGDGSLDYEKDILSRFDIVIASIHSNLKMTQEKAMLRLLNAIHNPFTSILGHMTGRLLLSRSGYPIDHKKIIEACAANNVVIELNAHPRRLDIDWRWIDYALEKNVLISINPDAHAIEGFDDCKYGVLVAQKTGLTKEQNLSSYSLEAFQQFVAVQQQKRS